MVRARWGFSSQEEWLRVPGELVWRRAYPGLPEQVGEARRFVESLFAGTGREQDAGLVVAELCNNSVLHTRTGRPGGWFGVEVVLADLAYLAVTDLGGGGRPRLEPKPFVEDPEPGGFGIALVEELAVAIGVHGSPALGHTVWADLDLTVKAVLEEAELLSR